MLYHYKAAVSRQAITQQKLKRHHIVSYPKSVEWTRKKNVARMLFIVADINLAIAFIYCWLPTLLFRFLLTFHIHSVSLSHSSLCCLHCNSVTIVIVARRQDKLEIPDDVNSSYQYYDWYINMTDYNSKFHIHSGILKFLCHWFVFKWQIHI